MTVAVRDAVVRFGDRTALDGVSLVAAPGTVTAVVGGDGAGKTTLMRLLVGRVPLDSGAVHAPELSDIGYLPATEGSWRGLTVQQNLDFVGGAYGMARDRLAERSEVLLEAAGLTTFRDRPAAQLSGGMRRKLGVCMAMLHEPSLLVLDEPSTGVDPVSRVDLWRLAAGAAAEGRTVVMTTSYLDEAERAGEVLVLDRGSTLISGPPEFVVDSLAGTLTQADDAVRPDWAWRRGRAFREIWLDEAPPADRTVVAPDLEDVVIAGTLVRVNGRDRS